ncbi:hypothetical protein SCLCIDRAFT_1207068 [Scleroderma citrinum Foug A]|uniref:Uncharacterized protein n=1 Tax=Scleroderma citrinum Foug A TaxID=1036808 RepID=A0A0C3B0T6_9AGAM|nr:hypothetical protein SCLCIDRAFT_1207068 [Scleroderma citrinum Foug A]
MPEIQELIEVNAAMFACLQKGNKALAQIEHAVVNDFRQNYGVAIVSKDSEESNATASSVRINICRHRHVVVAIAVLILRPIVSSPFSSYWIGGVH